METNFFSIINLIKRRYVIALIIPLLFSSVSFSQSHTDTLQIVKSLNDKKEFHQTEKLLQVYTKSHTGDFNTLWLYALTERWLKKHKTSKQLYRQAINIKPDNLYVQMDYAKELIEMGDLKTASDLLISLRKNKLMMQEAVFLITKITYWQGNYSAAYDSVIHIFKKDTSAKVRQLNNDIITAKAPWLKISTQYYSDNQPIQKITPILEAGWALKPLLNLRLHIQTPVYMYNTNDIQAQWFQLGNKFILSKIKSEALFDIGVFKKTNNPNATLTGNIHLKKNITQKLVMDAQAEYKPYVSTIKSLDTVCYVTHYTTSLAWQNQDSWNGKINLDYNQFQDNNHVYALYGWGYAPPLRLRFMEFRLGYAYSFSNSKDNRFEPTQTVSTIVANYLTTPTITGIYNPYFTPNHQNIHSALANFVLHPSKNIDAGINANIGVYAYTQNPYLYLDKDKDGTLVINKGYAFKNYTPVEVSAFVGMQLSKKLNLRADYSYRSTFFYTYWYAGLTLKFIFLDGQKWLR